MVFKKAVIVAGSAPSKAFTSVIRCNANSPLRVVSPSMITSSSAIFREGATLPLKISRAIIGFAGDGYLPIGPSRSTI